MKSILEEAHKSIINTDIKVGSLNKKDGNLLAMAVYLTIDNRYENYYLEEKSMHGYLASIIQDNINKKLHEGRLPPVY